MRGFGAAAIVILFLPALVSGQEPVKAFDQLNTRLKIGDKIFVTDANGQEHQGKILELSSSALTLDAEGGLRMPAADVQLVLEHERDSLKNGALIGLATGGGLAAGLIVLACTVEECDAEDTSYAALAIGMYAGIGAAVGTGIDALIPGRKRVVYSAPERRPKARLRLSPVISPRAKALTVALSF